MKLKTSTALLHTLNSDMELAIDNIKFEDEMRCLYSLNMLKTASIKLPSFSGELDEDFWKFKKEFETGLKSNRVRREDQVKKLRENLRNQPKVLILNTMKNIED